mmetsp:Transcript_1474/g.4247  ORF Transcript_1474/g.4247 Transcript_1474/m.4247 type:complete len:143 (-) Transcript_1474:423-851(-)
MVGTRAKGATRRWEAMGEDAEDRGAGLRPRLATAKEEELDDLEKAIERVETDTRTRSQLAELELRMARYKCVVHSADAIVEAIDTVFTESEDDAGGKGRAGEDSSCGTFSASSWSSASDEEGTVADGDTASSSVSFLSEGDC